MITIFPLVMADAAAVTYFSANGMTKVFPFGEAPQGILPPYAVHQTVSGTPTNQLNGRPQTDFIRTQVDVYGETQQQAYDGYKALEHALELDGHVTGLNDFAKDEQTNRWRASFDFTYYTNH